ncbi:MAG TPA: hypothetical protein VKQ34_03595 [Candidatus Saccharimonadales bacterium]|nr:hypothetical protein [Candidatus Saccharimonadales bacterium]
MGETTNGETAGNNLEQERHAAFETFRDVLLPADNSNEIAEKNEKQRDWDAENEQISLENRQEKQELRRLWNRILMYLVVAGFFFSYALIILIGFGVMRFANNAFAVPSVVAAGIVETYGLAKLAIKYFFSEDGHAPTKRNRRP